MPRGVPGSGGGNYGITIAANVKGTQNIKRLGNSMQGVQGKAKNLAMSLKGLVGPLTAIAGTAAIFKIFQESFQVLAEREADFATLANGLKRVSTDAPKAAKALKGIADELGFKTLFDEKAFQKGFSLLTSFKNIGIDSYGRVAETAADLAQINQVDLKSSFLQLAKALSDPARGLTALARSGVIFTEQQKEMILELQNSGREMEAQAAILKIVEASYQGAARSAASGLAGSFDTLGQKIRDFNEAFGTAAAPIVEPLIEGLSEVFGVVTEGLSLVQDDLLIFAKNLEKVLGPVFKWILDSIKNAFVWFDKLFATWQNLEKIKVKEGEGRFKDVRQRLWDEAGGIKDGAWFVDQKSEVVQLAKQMAGDAGNWRDFYIEARSEVFDKLVAEYVEKNLNLKAVIPTIKELKLNLDENLDVLASLKIKAEETGKSLSSAFGPNGQKKLQAFSDSLGDVGSQIADTVIKAFKGLEDQLVSFVTTGKMEFKKLAQSIIADMARIAIRAMIIKPIMAGFGLSGYAKGGVFENSNQITKYAKGGVFNSPHYFAMGGAGNFGVLGEAGPEAIMPLKRGKGGRLGVEAQGGGGTVINVAVDASGSQVEGDEEGGKMIGQLIATACKSIIINEQRPGGLLAGT